jgi:hypothetical protein
MALNAVFKTGQHISLPVATGTTSGSPLRIGSINAIAITDEGSVTVSKNLGGGISVNEPSGGVGNGPGYASVACDGAWNVAVTSSGAVAVGDLIYITGTAPNQTLTTTATGNKIWGASLQARSGTSGNLTVRIATNTAGN